MLEDKEIVLRFREGEEEAFRELYDKYAGYALRVAAAVTKRKASAADAVQETFIRVYKNIKSYDINQPFKPWFYKILINECNRLMKNVFRTIYFSDYFNNSPNEAYEDNHRILEHEELYEAIKGLKIIHRLPLILKYLNDFTENEIADILELNLNTVKSRLFKGRKKLREALEKQEERRRFHG